MKERDIYDGAGPWPPCEVHYPNPCPDECANWQAQQDEAAEQTEMVWAQAQEETP